MMQKKTVPQVRLMDLKAGQIMPKVYPAMSKKKQYIPGQRLKMGMSKRPP